VSSNWIRNGLDARSFQKRAGHSSIDQTMEHTDWLKGHDEAARAQANREDDRYAGQAVYKVAEVGA
jgi:hypothetical protein